MQPALHPLLAAALTLESSYSRGRRDEVRATGKMVDALIEDLADLVGFVFLDGCAYMGADMDEIDEERGAAALEARDRYLTKMRAAALDWRGALERPPEPREPVDE